MSKTILIADDDQRILNALRAFLEEKGYLVITAPDGWRGLDGVLQCNPDLLILDINMPGLDGFNALDMIRFLDQSRDLPVIILSAMGEKENVLKAAHLEADDFVIKPFDLEDLARRIRMQLITLDFNALRAVFENLREPEPDTFKELRGLYDPHWIPRLSMLSGMKLGVFFAPELRMKDPSQVTYEQCLNRVVVYARFPKKWRRIWPARVSGTAYTQATGT